MKNTSVRDLAPDQERHLLDQALQNKLLLQITVEGLDQLEEGIQISPRAGTQLFELFAALSQLALAWGLVSHYPILSRTGVTIALTPRENFQALAAGQGQTELFSDSPADRLRRLDLALRVATEVQGSATDSGSRAVPVADSTRAAAAVAPLEPAVPSDPRPAAAADPVSGSDVGFEPPPIDRVAVAAERAARALSVCRVASGITVGESVTIPRPPPTPVQRAAVQPEVFSVKGRVTGLDASRNYLILDGETCVWTTQTIDATWLDREVEFSVKPGNFPFLLRAVEVPPELDLEGGSNPSVGS